jgi:predicted transposase YdaD
MQESVIYQYILQKGKWEGKQEALQIAKQERKQEAEVLLILRLVSRRFGAVEPQIEERINQLSTTQYRKFSRSTFRFF